MLQKKWIGYSRQANLPEIAEQLLVYAGNIKLWLFLGDLGAGKTTLIKALCTQLGVKDVVKSPTFSLVHEYALPSGELMYHIDAYRVEPESAVVEWQSYIDLGFYCFIEWPSQLGSVALPTHIVVQLELQPDASRYIQAYIKT